MMNGFFLYISSVFSVSRCKIRKCSVDIARKQNMEEKFEMDRISSKIISF